MGSQSAIVIISASYVLEVVFKGCQGIYSPIIGGFSRPAELDEVRLAYSSHSPGIFSQGRLTGVRG